VLRFLPFLIIFVAAIYFGVRMPLKRLSPGGNGRRPLGPDDDPDFLRGLGKN